MKITGKNALLALLIALIITFLILTIYSLLALSVHWNEKEYKEAATLTGIFTQIFLPMLRMIGPCVLPIIFILAFALVQRFRIKN